MWIIIDNNNKNIINFLFDLIKFINDIGGWLKIESNPRDKKHENW